SQRGEPDRFSDNRAASRTALPRGDRLPLPVAGWEDTAMIVAITGASAGVGRATAREFAAKGWDVAVIARNKARLDEAASELHQLGRRALAVEADVGDYALLQ